MSTIQPRPGPHTEPDTAALRVLAEALRMPKLPLPPGILWHMGCYGHCAWAVAVHIGLVNTWLPWFNGNERNAFGLTRTQSKRLFSPGALLELEGLTYDQITPAIQADRIEQFIREVETAKEHAA